MMSETLQAKYKERPAKNAKIQDAASRVLQSGRLFRYDVDAQTPSEAALLEKEYADFIGTKYGVALSSCSAAIHLALRSLGVVAGSKVLIPAFTFVAVPSAVTQINAQPVLVEVTKDLYICPEDLVAKITDETKVLLLSHMRGHVGNIEQIVEICHAHGVKVIEDAAHALGMEFKGKKIGSFGDVACFSMQSYKMLDSGEGGMLVTDDEDIAARVIIYSGSYDNLWKTHIARPSEEKLSALQKDLPCMNVRMSNLSAAIVRAQIEDLPEKIEHFRASYTFLQNKLAASDHIYVPVRPENLYMAPDSIQFTLVSMTQEQKDEILQTLEATGLPFHNFNHHNARCYWNWRFISGVNECPKTRALLEYTFDLKLPYNLDENDLTTLSEIILGAIDGAMGRSSLLEKAV